MQATILPFPDYMSIISRALEYKVFQVEVVLHLIAEGSTVPFIARYRKERTGNLDENDIRAIIELHTKEENLHKAKQTAINGIEEIGKLTPELMKNIIGASTLKEVDEIYKPYKSKKKTKAMIAIEKGFQVVANAIKKNIIIIPDTLLLSFTKEEIIEGAIDIISAEISSDSLLRHTLIAELQRAGDIVSTKKSDKMLERLNQKDTEQIPKFAQYYDFNIRISRIKPYQILALNRGENLGILSIRLEKSDDIFESVKNTYGGIILIKNIQSWIIELVKSFELGYEALFSSAQNEIRGELSDIGEEDAIRVFQTNLQALLMSRPEYGKTILAIDPGYRAGCKICIIDSLGNPIGFDKIFLHEEERAKNQLSNIFQKYTIDTVVIGNGTGCDETSEMIGKLYNGEVAIVNESGASVYSANSIAQEEFPDLDSLDRGTVSIGRRYIDPLSELVKIPVGSIGVGMYQHDITENKLIEKLGYVVEDVVNEVGISVNNASVYVLNHISGINKREAKKIYNHRPYKSRSELQKILSEKVYTYAIGFLRVPESSEKLDNTDIHPDQYPLAKYIIENHVTRENYESHKQSLIGLYNDTNRDTIDFIRESYENIGIEKRVVSTHSKAHKKLAMDQIKEGSIFDGIIRNVVAFGAFVDIGLKSDGLIHISQLANKFVSNPNDIVSVGDHVKVKVTQIDTKTGKIQLSMKDV